MLVFCFVSQLQSSLHCNLLCIAHATQNRSARCNSNFEGHVLDSYELRVCSEAHRVTSSKFGKWWLHFDGLFFRWQRATEALNHIDHFLGSGPQQPQLKSHYFLGFDHQLGKGGDLSQIQH